MYTVINKMKIIFKTILILFIITISASSEIVKEIKVDGNERVSTETVKIFSGVKINSDLTSNQINDILKNLFSTNYFSDISINLKNNILYISVKENPIIQNVNFDGVKNKRILEVLNDQIELKEKNSFVENKVKNDVDKITNILRSNGFYFADVKTKLKKNDNNTVDLIYNINLGERAHIKKITFIGDKKIKDNKLKKIIVSEEAKFWKFISNKKYLDVNRIKLDENLLLNYYKNKGYFNISVESSSAKVINETDFELIFNINAGEKFYFGNISLLLPEDFSNESFKKIIKTKNDLEGEIYSLSKIKKILNKIDEIALTKEFEFITAKYTETINKNKIDLSIKLSESEKFYIERINIYGNYTTAENVIRNSLIVDEISA